MGGKQATQKKREGTRWLANICPATNQLPGNEMGQEAVIIFFLGEPFLQVLGGSKSCRPASFDTAGDVRLERSRSAVASRPSTPMQLPCLPSSSVSFEGG